MFDMTVAITAGKPQGSYIYCSIIIMEYCKEIRQSYDL